MKKEWREPKAVTRRKRKGRQEEEEEEEEEQEEEEEEEEERMAANLDKLRLEQFGSCRPLLRFVHKHALQQLRQAGKEEKQRERRREQPRTTARSNANFRKSHMTVRLASSRESVCVCVRACVCVKCSRPQRTDKNVGKKKVHIIQPL